MNWMTLYSPFGQNWRGGRGGARLLAPLAALILGALLPLAAHGPAQAAGGARISGVVTNQPGDTAPTSFQLRRRTGAIVTVQVSGSTAVVRRFNGPTDIAAVSIDDSLQIWGTFEAGRTVFDATRIQDRSIQEADAYARGKVTSVDVEHSTFTFQVTLAPPGSPLAGEVSVNLAPNRPIRFPDGTRKTIAGLQVGDVVFVRGVYDRRSHVLNDVDAIRVDRLAGAPGPEGATIDLNGLVAGGYHYLVVLVHTGAHIDIHLVVRADGRVYRLAGRTGPDGTFRAQQLLGYGRWPSAHLVSATAYLFQNQSEQISSSAYIA